LSTATSLKILLIIFKEYFKNNNQILLNLKYLEIKYKNRIIKINQLKEKPKNEEGSKIENKFINII